MRLPSSSSLILASLAVSSSSSSSSLSALAAPAGDGLESLLSSAPVPPAVPPVVPSVPPVPPHAPVPHGSDHGSDDTKAQPNGHPQARNLVDTVTGPLPVSPDLVKAIHAIVDPLIGAKEAPKARAGPLDVVKPLIPVGKTVRAEAADEAGVDGASEDSSSQAEAGASTSPAAGSQDAPVAAPNPPADCQSQSQPSPRSGPVRRQAPGASNGESGGSPDPNPPAPPPPVPSGPGGNVGGNPGGDVA